MSVDLEAIAQRGRCDVSSLRLALPLLEQGYTPPFLARYRRDELGGIDESSLWALSSALQTERQIAERREELQEAWQQTPLRDPAIGQAISKSNSLRMLARLQRRLKSESHESPNDATRLAVRVLNPQKGDGDDLALIAASIEGLTDPQAAVAGLDVALAKRLAGDPRIVGAAVRWLVKHARVHVAAIRDPHTSGDAEPPKDSAGQAAPQQQGTESAPTPQTATPSSPPATSEDSQPTPDPSKSAEQQPAAETTAAEATVAEATAAETPAAETPAPETTAAEPTTAAPSVAETPTAAEPTTAEPAVSTPPAEPAIAAAATDVTEAGKPDPASDPAGDDAASAAKAKGASDAKKMPSSKDAGKSKSKEAKKKKKISPRQRRRRWLVSVLKPLEGKRLGCDKLSAFQIVMLGRALRSQVAECSFEYDATKLVAELQRVTAGINRHLDEQLRDIVLRHEANIREAAETAWWDDLHERASCRLASITADHLRQHVNRGGVEAKVVMAIDAVGPRTAATAIVSADGRLLHREDLPCQLSSALRSQAVAKMGELIHTYHVDLIVVSNGPARRATMVSLGDLIAQSPEKSVRWTLADRSGADAYSSSSIANEEMRSTPRRFRAAAWLAFSVLQPAQALAKVDPLKLRLSSFQRELSDEAVSNSLQDVMVSGASRGGVDVNSAPVSWLQRLPGVSAKVAHAIDAARRQSLFSSRDAVSELEHWESPVQSRQAVPFLRVFGGQEVLDGTLIHPEDYALAKKLASVLEIELPPDAPPGYVAPDFSIDPEPTEPGQLVETTSETTKADVEEFSGAGDAAPEFVVDGPSTDVEVSGDKEAVEGETPPATESAVPSPEGSASQESPATDPPPTESSTEKSEAEPSAAEVEPSAAEVEPSAAEVEPSAAEVEPSAAAEEASATESSTSPKAAIPDPIKRSRPERAKIDKCIKEWQIGARRAQQLVQWLCDPFGDSDATGSPPAVLTTMPTPKNLKPGDVVIGVVVGVMPFGVFVELAPDCSGLIHVSRVSDSYVEDLHEAVQVGDVITSWVTGIDDKRRRVALSAISPQREAELEESRRRTREERAPRGGPRRGGGRAQAAQPRGGEARGGQPGGQAGGSGVRAGQSRGGQRVGGQGAGNQGASQGRGTSRRSEQAGGGRSRDGGRGGRPRDARGGKRRDKKPESYRVVGKKEAKPITDAMQQGKEPLRSFGDLLQFYDKATAPEKTETGKTDKGDTETGKTDIGETATPGAETDASAQPPSDSIGRQPADASPSAPTSAASGKDQDTKPASDRPAQPAADQTGDAQRESDATTAESKTPKSDSKASEKDGNPEPTSENSSPADASTS